jgi:hypothetical protein
VHWFTQELYYRCQRIEADGHLEVGLVLCFLYRKSVIRDCCDNGERTSEYEWQNANARNGSSIVLLRRLGSAQGCVSCAFSAKKQYCAGEELELNCRRTENLWGSQPEQCLIQDEGE